MYVITGAAGFIGSNLVATLHERDVGPVVVCDVFGSGQKWLNLRKHAFHDWIEPGSLLSFLETHEKAVTAVVHLGAISSTVETNTDFILRNNFVFSRDIFEWATRAQKRLIYASSAATYGNGLHGFEDDESLGYLKKLQPLNPYGWSKHLFDQYVFSRKDPKTPWPNQCAGLKFFNVYGPNEYHKEGQMSVAWQLYQQAMSQRASLELFKSYRPDYKDGQQTRDFIWVQDCVDVIVWLLENQTVSGLFNVGSGKARSFLDLAKIVQGQVSCKTSLVFKDMPVTLRDKYQYHTQANMAKLHAFGYRTPMTSLEDGVQFYIQDYLSKEDSYR